MDGWGLAETWGGNAIGLANTPCMDHLYKYFVNTRLNASGEAVGLPFNEPGNSEVGHFNIGSGQIAGQGLTAINLGIENKSFFSNDVLTKIMIQSCRNNKTLHLMGLISDGGIHSHIDHLFALLELAKQNNLKDVVIHAFTDGRDSPSTSGLKYVQKIEKKCQELNLGVIASISGRYFAMDRDSHWDRIQRAYDVIIGGKGEGEAGLSAESVLLKSYANGITDEFITPTIINKNKSIKNGDNIILFNFRSDRARQLTKAIIRADFNDFKRSVILNNIELATFCSYQDELGVKVVFEAQKTNGQLASVLAENNLTHLHIAETEKYAHVTYFFNGGVEPPFGGEERILVNSPHVATYDLKPEMSAEQVVSQAVGKIPDHDFTVINFANADMVGHTGNMSATIKAVEAVDTNLKKLINLIIKNDYIGIVTADHGNAEQMINPLTGLPDTEHTINPVPFIIVRKGTKLRNGGRICDISPTIVDLLDLPKPKEMLGKSLIV